MEEPGDRDAFDARLGVLSLDTIPLNLAILSRDGTILWTNRAWREYGEARGIGGPSDTIGENYLEVAERGDDDWSARAAAGLRSVLSGRRDAFELVYPCHEPSGPRWFELRAVGVEADSGRFASVGHLDVTRSELYQRQFELVAEAASQVLFTTDVDGTITFVNPTFEAVTGYSAAEAIGQTPALLRSDEHTEAFYADLWETILAGETWEGTLINRRASGDLYYAETTIVPVHDDEGGLVRFLCLQTEVTDIEHFRRYLEKLDDVLRHDLRTELSVILGHAQSLERGLLDDPAEESEALAAIVDSTRNILDTSTRARELAAFLQEEVERRPVDLARCLEELVAEQEAAAPEVSFDIDVTEPAVFKAVDGIEQAFIELIQNAIEHNDGEQPRVVITVAPDAKGVAVEIADNGPGLSDAEMTTLESVSSDPIEHGTGIGLDIAYWYIRRSGGWISAAESQSGGTRVTVWLPASRPE